MQPDLRQRPQEPPRRSFRVPAVLAGALLVIALLSYYLVTGVTSSLTPQGPSAQAPTEAPAPVAKEWPGPTNTGVLPGTQLEPYTGPCDIKNKGFVIDSVVVDCPGLLIYAPDVVIRNSKVNGPVRTNSPTASVRIEDSEIDGRNAQSEAVGYDHVTVLRSNVYGNQHSVHCGVDCRVEDSWLHDQYDGAAMDWHQNGFLTNGGRDIVLRHNTIACVGGCTAAVALIPDDDISNVLVENNLIVASPDGSFCIYGGETAGKPGTATGIVFKDNIVQRGSNGLCGRYGPVTNFHDGVGNQWVNNRWDNGTELPPAS